MYNVRYLSPRVRVWLMSSPTYGKKIGSIHKKGRRVSLMSDIIWRLKVLDKGTEYWNLEPFNTFYTCPRPITEWQSPTRLSLFCYLATSAFSPAFMCGNPWKRPRHLTRERASVLRVSHSRWEENRKKEGTIYLNYSRHNTKYAPDLHPPLSRLYRKW